MSEQTVRVDLTQQQDYRFAVRFGGSVAELIADEPAPLGGGAGPSPVQLLAASVGNCLADSLLFALRKFKQDSPDYADALDTQASLAIFDLDLAATEEAVAKIKERSAEVYRLTKLISGIGKEASANANILNGTLITHAIDAATLAISSFKQLREKLSATDATEKTIAAEIDKVLVAVQGLRNKLENP